MNTKQHTTVTFLGTDAVVPAGGGDTASFVINGKYLVDTGWYAAIKMRSYGLDPMDVEYLILTHCHHDHYLGLPHLLFYLAMRRSERPERPALKIIGPAGEMETVVVRANAYVNQVAVVNVNAAAPVGNGRSLVIDPEGAVRYEAGVGEEVVTAVLDLDQVQRVRERGSFGLNKLWEEMDRVGPGLELPLYGGYRPRPR